MQTDLVHLGALAALRRDVHAEHDGELIVPVAEKRSTRLHAVNFVVRSPPLAFFLDGGYALHTRRHLRRSARLDADDVLRIELLDRLLTVSRVAELHQALCDCFSTHDVLL